MKKQYGTALKAARREAGKTLANVADFLGVSASYISDVERGNRSPLKAEHNTRVAYFLGTISADELLTLADEARGYSVIPLKDVSEQAAALGTAFARKWPQVSESPIHLQKLTAYLDKLREK